MKLNDVCDFIVDCPHSTDTDEGKGYPIIRTPNIGKGRLSLDGVFRVSESVYNARNKRGVPQKNDLIFAREAPAGNFAIIKGAEKVCLGQRTVLLRPKKDVVYPDFLVYYLLAPRQQYNLLGTANGATVAHVNLPTIRNLPIELPSIEKQIKIGNILSAYDDLIENNRKQIKLLEEAAQRLYKEWFIDLRFPGWETTPIVDGLPEGWKKGALSDIAKVNARNISKGYSQGYIDYIDIGSVRAGIIEAKNRYLIQDAPGRARRVCVDGDVVWGMVRPNLRAYALVLNPSNSMVFSSGFSTISAIEVPFSYLYCAVTQDSFVGYLVNCTNGAAYPAVKPIHFEKAQVTRPTSKLLDMFHQRVEPMLRKIALLDLQNTELTQARDVLLPKLMSGEIEV